MKFAATLSLAGLAAAAPLQGSPFRFAPGTPEGHRPGSYVPGSIIKGRAIGPGTAAVLGGVVSGVVAPAVTRWANKALGPTRKLKRDCEDSDVEGELVVGDNVTWDEVREAFLQGVTTEISEDADPEETAICVGVPYNVDDESKVDDAASVDFTANGNTAVFDCFLLAAGATFSVAPENATEANVEIISSKPVELDANGSVTV
ncbi:hypothetical protein M409DRAFT_16489 [Zasmidium cellare ATCC 36951]|uniref:DUF7888 domain-containing protein n=1 Tax=Zasmidium cellare ATCC 36951 TaxID=1080233 RepID=A0A6A6D512_ZASCE|nr:uncharacterized protein M409DRAFT_16489 [Zasmidium cellare ATCC 36951]KAF2174223.1 hypothetical protein M409DRAFT_16489 [Zasmidium cellare ATCC 36951]